jgi:ATP-dependent DNA helicase DinG
VALQEQLVQRDIPLYLRLNGIEAKVALAKGRGRYLCPRNLAMAANSLNDSAQMGLAGMDADLAIWVKPPRCATSRRWSSSAPRSTTANGMATWTARPSR